MEHPQAGNVSQTPPRYEIYVLRCWQERSSDDDETVKVWRFSLEDPHTGQRQGFAGLEALLVALQADLIDE
jgi:hypothetical protein